MTQTKLIKPKKLTRPAKLKARVKAIKLQLLQIGWDEVKNILLKYYPEYDRFDQYRTVYNVWHMLGSDEKLTEILEDIVKGKLTL